MENSLLQQYRQRLSELPALRERKSSIRRLQLFYSRAIQRVSGEWAGNAPTGEEFSNPAHPYAADLNVFGEGSLFQLLCTVRTAIGQGGLARYLLSSPSIEEILSRQESIKELRDRTQLRERMALLGEMESSQLQWKTFEEWVDLPNTTAPRFLQGILVATVSILAVSLLATALRLVPWNTVTVWLVPIVVFHSMAGLYFRERFNRLLAWLQPMSVEIRTLKAGLRLLRETRFESGKLRDLAARVENSSLPIRRLSLLLILLGERDKEWFYVPSLAIMAGTQIYLAIERWRAEHGAVLGAWLDAWAEFETLNALANYAHENPGNTFPQLSCGSAEFDAKALGHPLLPDSICVRNDVQLNSETRFYLVSGSNMSGKSTLLRSIGSNTILAYCGAPVTALSLRLSPMSLCASLSVVDSLANGKSKFMTEVDRLRHAIETATAGKPVLFLIDEIFSGTNSRDRRVAAEAVVRTLVNHGAIGLVSTHDLALTEIATRDFRGVNMHTGSKDGSDPMDFDYLLKPGVTEETNALAIARMAGVPLP